MSVPGQVRRTALTLGAAVGVFGISFGVIATGTGLSIAMTCAMSLFVFTGATQFAVVGVLASGGSPISAIGSGLLLGARHIGYGLSLRRTIRGPLWRRLLAAQFLIDESTVLATSQPDRRNADGAFWWGGLSVFVCWNIGTAIGAVVGDTFGDPESLGLDAVFSAAFLALLVPLLRRRDAWVAALVGAAIALTLVPFLPAGLPIVAASVGALVGARSQRREAESP